MNAKLNVFPYEWYVIVNNGEEIKYSNEQKAEEDFKALVEKNQDGDDKLLRVTIISETSSHLQRLYCPEARLDQKHFRHSWHVNTDSNPMRVVCPGYRRI